MPKYDQQVFVNCPFTDDYGPLFDAIVFAVMDCGFVPRCALEQTDFVVPRIEKILRMVSECRYGIHDISVTELDPDHHLPRFNMPLELGIFLGAQRFGSVKQKKKSCLVLDREQYRYQIFCSDIAGQDPKVHDDDPKEAIKCIRAWLRGQVTDTIFPGANRIFERFEAFLSDLPIISDGLHLDSDDLHFNDYTTVIEEWLRLNPW